MTTTSNYPSPEVLIAIVNNQRALEIARAQRWYRIPVKSADRFIQDDIGQIQYLAFYQTMIFKRGAFTANYYAEIERISTALWIEKISLVSPFSLMTCYAQRSTTTFFCVKNSTASLPCPCISPKKLSFHPLKGKNAIGAATPRLIPMLPISAS